MSYAKRLKEELNDRHAALRNSARNLVFHLPEYGKSYTLWIPVNGIYMNDSSRNPYCWNDDIRWYNILNAINNSSSAGSPSYVFFPTGMNANHKEASPLSFPDDYLKFYSFDPNKFTRMTNYERSKMKLEARRKARQSSKNTLPSN